MAPSHTQSGVMKGAGLALSVIMISMAVTMYRPHGQPSEPVFFWLLWNIPKLLPLAAAIGATANHRFYTPADIDGAGLTVATPKIKVLQAILQNTLEQVVLAVFVHGAWVAVMAPELHECVAVASVLFVLGRLFFWVGYSRGAAGRAFGFGLTFYPSMLMLVVMCCKLFCSVG